MKAISLLQPWASLVVLGYKKIETRSWNTKYRGEVLIHASLGKKKSAIELAQYNPIFYNALQTEVEFHGFDDLPFGAIIGKVNITGTVLIQTLFGQTIVEPEDLSKTEEAFGEYKDGRFAWLLSDPVHFKKITPFKGSLNIWNFDEQICLKCGCTDDNACMGKLLGPCWWAGTNLCSHCAKGIEKL